MTLVAALTLAQFSIVVLGWIAVLLPAPSVTAAAGAASLGAAALIWRDHSVWMKDTQPWIALAMMICGLGLVAVSVSNRREKAPRPALVSAFAGLLAVATGAVWAAIAFSGIDAVDLHYAALEWPSAAVLSLALAGAAAFNRRPALRYASVPLATAGFVAVAFGSTSFLDRFANDPFLPSAASVTVATVASEARAEFTVPFEVNTLRFSPDGAFVALGSENDDYETTIHAGRAGGPLTDFTADQAVFVGDGRLLLLERQRVATVLRVVDLRRENRELWSLRLPLSAVHLSLDSTSSEWRLLGWNDGDIVSVAGTVDNHQAPEERWKTPADDIDYVDALSVSRGTVLALETRHRPSFVGNRQFWWWLAVVRSGVRAESRFWTVSERGNSAFLPSRLDLRCEGASTGDEGATCTAFDGARTGFFAVDPLGRRSTPLASVDGHFYLLSDTGRGWVLGRWDRGLVLLRAAKQQAIRVAEADGTSIEDLAIAGQTLGAASWNGHASTIRLYSIDR
jgi:hypothetical protein